MGLFLNHYECPCGASWTDEWACTCNDRCPKCNKEIEPTKSEDLGLDPTVLEPEEKLLAAADRLFPDSGPSEALVKAFQRHPEEEPVEAESERLVSEIKRRARLFVDDNWRPGKSCEAPTEKIYLMIESAMMIGAEVTFLVQNELRKKKPGL